MRFLAAALCLSAGMAQAQTITAATFDAPTTRYDHGILGDAVEYGALRFTVTGADGAARGFSVTLPETHVFEDSSPRLWDITGDGAPEIVVIETDMMRGAALAIYGVTGKMVQTPYIGQTHRWLAPIGAADLDGDGRIEVAYIDRPHLAKTLRIWEWRDGTLMPEVDLQGLTNHRIGDDMIAGGLRLCGGVAEFVTASADWSRIMVTSFANGGYASRDIGSHTPAGMAAALICED